MGVSELVMNRLKGLLGQPQKKILLIVMIIGMIWAWMAVCSRSVWADEVDAESSAEVTNSQSESMASSQSEPGIRIRIRVDGATSVTKAGYYNHLPNATQDPNVALSKTVQSSSTSSQVSTTQLKQPATPAERPAQGHTDDTQTSNVKETQIPTLKNSNLKADKQVTTNQLVQTSGNKKSAGTSANSRKRYESVIVTQKQHLSSDRGSTRHLYAPQNQLPKTGHTQQSTLMTGVGAIIIVAGVGVVIKTRKH